jgi:hypothetical protein
MGRIGVQLGKSPPVTRIDRAPASSARHPAVMVRFASQQRLAFPVEFRLVESLRSAAVEERFLLPVRSVSLKFGTPADVATIVITAMPKLPPSSLRRM